LHPALITFFSAALILRLLSMVISRRNERRLRAAGAEEFGARNSRVLALLHAAFYAAAFGEGIWRHTRPDGLSVLGMSVYALSMLALALVVHQLGPLWTVKLYLAPDHSLNQSWLFRAVRHPNYFLNVLPELVGLALAFKAWLTLAVLLPIYLIPLGIRISQEERAMKQRFARYR
jgi:isoprenylcysteine carboxyl methyltransferase (ICMT) family protein YpbQ